ncbi:MAG: hypothetical protein QG592_2017 [Pseudomonadota bacterium]|nr:hypothetical protein [Pseudomonadota bacterium]
MSGEKVVIGNATLFHADCREVLPTLPVHDLLLTDPPYGIGIAANPVRQAHQRMDWDSDVPPAWLFGLMLEKGRQSILWGGNYFALPPSQSFLVWDKAQPENFSLAMCEQAWCSFKRPAKLFRLSVTSYEKEHPTQKPAPLMAWCIKQSPDAQTVLDPFMGSGTTGVACVQLGRAFTGIERERKYFDIACERISRAQAQGALFPHDTPAAPVQVGFDLEAEA